MTAVRDQVAVVETDNVADLVLSQGGMTIANLVRYQFQVGNLSRRYSSPLKAERCSNLVPHVLPPATEDFDMVDATLNLVVHSVRKMDLSSWLPLRELSSWSDHADHLVAIRGWSQSPVALVACSDFGLLHDRFIEAKKPWPENSTLACWWQPIDDRVLLCVEEVARASTSSHFSCHFDGFMVLRDVPPVTSSQQFLHNLATHLWITTGSPSLSILKEHFSFTQLLVRTAQQTHRLVPARGAGRHGRRSGIHSPANALVMRPAIGFEIPKDGGSSLILIVMQDLGWCVCEMVVASNCSGSF